MFRPAAVLIFTLLLTLAGGVSAQRENLPRLEQAECGFDVPPEALMSCYDLVVPESRAVPDSPPIRLRVAVAHAYGQPYQQDPVIYLDGGPGGDTLAGMPFIYYSVGYPFNETRDVVFFDQRGVGLSRPSLDCPEYQNTRYDLLDERPNADELRARVLDAMLACRRRLESRGVNLAVYNSAENAADLEDLRLALNRAAVNLYGISYGTRLALTYMRDYPTGIRSVILDSVLPPQASLYNDQPANLERALNTLFLACTQDAACSQRYPRLGTRFYETVAALNTAPLNARINHPTTRMELAVRVDGDMLIGLAFGALYNAQTFVLLPQIIEDVGRGSTRLLASTLESILEEEDGWSMGMHFAVQCREETPFTTYDSVADSLAALPAFERFFAAEPNTGTMMMAICQGWNLPPSPPEETQPVSSSIPTFVAAGQYDPITPPRWARMAADTLSSSYYYEFPGVGHGATVADDCPRQMMVAFVDSPTQTPPSSCMAAMDAPEFLIVDNSLELEPFADAETGIASVRPAAWIDYGGEFHRSEIDSTQIRFNRMDIAQLTGAPAQDIIDYYVRDVAAEFDIYDVPPPAERREANGLFWQVYEFRRGDQYLDVAAAADGTTIYWVLLLSEQSDRDLLYTSVLTPAIDNLRPYDG